MNTDKLNHAYQDTWINSNIYDLNRLKLIGKNVKINKDIDSPVSSAASCINVLGSLTKEELISYLNTFGLKVTDVLSFPTGTNLSGEVYDDRGLVVFEWIGARISAIYEGSGGRRGERRTSVDAYILAIIDHKVTQLLIEWKFTETPLRENFFAGLRGNERLRRYSSVLAKLRKKKDFPFKFSDEGGLGLNDFGYDTFYQMMRMTLLAKMTMLPSIQLKDVKVEDYRFIHLTHSDNKEINILGEAKTQLFANLQEYSGISMHGTWKKLLSDHEKTKYFGGHWNQSFSVIKNKNLKKYLIDRYE